MIININSEPIRYRNLRKNTKKSIKFKQIRSLSMKVLYFYRLFNVIKKKKNRKISELVGTESMFLTLKL